MNGSVALIGATALSLEAARSLREAGFRLALVASRYPELDAFAEEHDIPRHDPDRLDDLPEGIDWLLSAGNLDLVPAPALARFAAGAINFHDGPLPERVGRNAPVWALLEGARRHAVTWHMMTPGVDAGDILIRRDFDIDPEETAQSLNARCFALALETLPELIEQMRHGLRRRPQPAIEGRMHRAADRPSADALIDGRGPVDAALRLVRALDHGAHPNPLCCPKISHEGRLLLIGTAQLLASGAQPAPPGTIRAAMDDALELVFDDGVLRLSGLSRPDGAPVALPKAGTRLAPVRDAAALTMRMQHVARAEHGWRRRLEALRPVPLPGLATVLPMRPDMAEERRALEPHGSARLRAAAWALLAARLCDGAADLALVRPAAGETHVADWVPLRIIPEPGESLSRFADRFDAEMRAACAEVGFAADLPMRLSLAPPAWALGPARPPGARLGFDPEAGILRAAGGTLVPGALDLLAARLMAMIDADHDTACTALPAMSPGERALLLEDWNDTAGPVPEGTIHAAIARRAATAPEAVALVFGEERLTHAELEARSNRMARVLREMGAGPGMRVGLHMGRSTEMVVAALGVMKSGAAYLPLDPAYPRERLALYLEDSSAAIVVSAPDIASDLPIGEAALLRLDDPRLDTAEATPLDEAATDSDLAYLIYTSGSTGRPKGVMIEHRHVLNFFEGMDERVPHRPGDALLAVTSISFDISVLELFWSLSRGLKVVVQGDEERLLTSSETTPVSAGAGPSLSLFYWGHEAGDTDDYSLLLDGARFADAHGFEAVWTPERHFHGFGAAYPNPAVTGAAVAAVTSHVAIRAGSCVAPLHHPARIAEDWAVIDRLSGGRAGVALAAGWQPQDFVLRPEAAPPANRKALHDAVDAVRRLWRGEAVAFPDAAGEMQEVLTRPRPVSSELPLWITVAGNPTSWREAGLAGANVLTHLLGQSVADLSSRIAEWRAALIEAGHDPASRRVTVMLHTYLAESRAAAREVARGPMIDYLRSANGLIARHAAEFPAFRRGGGGAVDPGALTPEEETAVLDHAFERYFEEQGLFGSVEDGLARIEVLQAAGVDEIACLIDFGIAPARVMEGLPRLAALAQRGRPAVDDAGPPASDRSIAAQIRRHGITHLQCTPSMARMLAADAVSRAALGGLRHMLVGGEALPAALVEELRGAGVIHLENMYGPTETTIWSTSATIEAGLPATVIGRPIRNTRTYVLDAQMSPCPVGVEGELWIGGAGVARGYWERAELTADRFRPDPFRPGERIYRTGDLARWRADGLLDFIGRADGQVKLRGHRIELGEVEAALDAISGFGPCVAVLREDTPGDTRLVAYLETTEPVDEAELRRELATRLPAIMVPARIVALERFPLTPNRKTDRAALPPPPAHRAAVSPTPTPTPTPADPAPSPATIKVTGLRRGAAATEIAEIWRELLGIEAVSPNDSFFDLGGHSLLAVRAHREIRDRLGLPDLRITDIFGLPRLADLAARIEAELTAPEAAEPVAPLPSANARDEIMARRRQLRARRQGLG
ncbi:MupA/Atu3671 family FMN-dependent luciferase-like monooxygenase [Limimaricola soesokkakensis]|uniref:MupA/Atu3671 family FMN-dependent luciferase-like monooxygenase n=1 Tax=Limimaricola soesokkakensis TaxID=1343159 RepID=UPI003517EE37